MAKLSLPLLLCASSVTGFSAPIACTSAIRSTTPAMSLPANLKQTASAVLLAAALVAAPFDAEAAGGRSGGRVGGRTSSAPSRSYSRPATNSRPAAAGTTNVIVTPGYGMGYGYGGFGMSPGMTGAYLGLSLADTLIREQQRQAFLQRQLETQRQLGQDQANAPTPLPYPPIPSPCTPI